MKDENSCQVVGECKAEAVDASGGAVARRTYAAPVLRHLGSVRELTFASKGNPFPDGVITQAPM
jgi:hypothetical protein